MHRLGVVAIVMIGITVADGASAADRWVGTSTALDAGGGRCTALTFDLTIDGNVIAGSASSPVSTGRMEWRIAGSRNGTSVKFDTLHRELVGDGRLQQIAWTGRIAGDQLQITQQGQSVSCSAPRSAVLRRG
jgi:hypothetical protein